MKKCLVSFISRGPEETVRFAGALAAWADRGTVIALQGEVGVGKTLIAKALAAALGIEETITSPTFGLVMEYRLQNPEGRFCHLDLYRLQSPEQALAFGVEEYLFAPDAITLVEWPERIITLLRPPGPESHRRLLYIELYHQGGDHRKIILPRQPGAEIMRKINPEN